MKKLINYQYIKEQDEEMAKLNEEEEKSQLDVISLIPSQNYCSVAVREATSTVFTNKYSEGYPSARYYPDNHYVDKIEIIAQKRALEFFGLDSSEWFCNVQPYSGSPANLAIYTALMKKGEVALGMSLSAGGHLTHGHKVSASGMFFDFYQYGVGSDERIDFLEVEKLAKEKKPKVIVCGCSAYSREVDFEKFREVADSVGAVLVADISHISGLVATNLHKSPFGYADVVMTTTHKMLRGPRGAMIIAKKEYEAKINKAIIPGLQGGPHNNIIFALAVALKEANTKEYKEYTKQIIKNANVLCSSLQDAGYKIVSGGTDNHLFLLDLRDKDFSGIEAERRLEEVGVSANRNTIPKEPGSPFDPTGIRMGTPMVTTRGMKEEEMKKLALIIDKALGMENIEETKKDLLDLAHKFPPPGFIV